MYSGLSNACNRTDGRVEWVIGLRTSPNSPATSQFCSGVAVNLNLFYHVSLVVSADFSSCEDFVLIVSWPQFDGVNLWTLAINGIPRIMVATNSTLTPRGTLLVGFDHTSRVSKNTLDIDEVRWPCVRPN